MKRNSDFSASLCASPNGEDKVFETDAQASKTGVTGGVLDREEGQ